MPPNSKPTTDPAETLPPVSLQSVLLLFLTILAGALLAINLAPLWVPAVNSSVSGSEPKVFWFLSRGSAIAAYWILWLAMCMGVVITNKMAQIWPGIPPAYEIHQYTSLLGMGFALFHALILIGDRYIAYTLPQVLIPFAGQDYRPVWVGIGQAAFYIWGVVNASFYIRKRIGKNAWRLVHFASYACFWAVLLHGVMAGTDTSSGAAQISYWFSGASLLFLTVYRALAARVGVEVTRPKRASS